MSLRQIHHVSFTVFVHTACTFTSMVVSTVVHLLHLVLRFFCSRLSSILTLCKCPGFKTHLTHCTQTFWGEKGVPNKGDVTFTVCKDVLRRI